MCDWHLPNIATAWMQIFIQCSLPAKLWGNQERGSVQQKPGILSKVILNVNCNFCTFLRFKNFCWSNASVQVNIYLFEFVGHEFNRTCCQISVRNFEAHLGVVSAGNEMLGRMLLCFRPQYVSFSYFLMDYLHNCIWGYVPPGLIFLCLCKCFRIRAGLI